MKALGDEAHLTLREQEVLDLIAAGYSAKEIAKTLDIAPRTVERHTENVRLKMRARNRAHMIVNAINLGLLPVASNLGAACAECLFRTQQPAFFGMNGLRSAGNGDRLAARRQEDLDLFPN